MATIIISGRLTTDVKKGENAYFFTVAENKRMKTDESNYFNCIAKVSEKQAEYLKKGKAVEVVGDLSIDFSTDGEGKKYTNVNVFVYDLRFTIGGKKDDEPGKA